MTIRFAHKLVIGAFAVSGVSLIGSGLWDVSTLDRSVSSSLGNNPNAGTKKSKASIIVQDRVSNNLEFSKVSQATRQAASHNRINYDEELQTERPIVHLDSVATLMSHIDETPPDLVDFDSVVNLINDSTSAFDYISSEYLSSTDPKKQRILLNALNNSSNPARVNFALDLAHSINLQQRRSAYSWLSRSTSTVADDLIYETLVDATYHEDDSKTLIQLVSSIPLANLSRTSDIHERAILRLNELAFHPDEAVSSAAIAKISKSAINERTLSILQMHLQDSSESRQLAALEGLRNFDQPSEELMVSLNAILYNSDLPQKNRGIAARVLIDFENQLYPPKNL